MHNSSPIVASESANDEVQEQNMEDLARRIVGLERWVSRQEGEIRGTKEQDRGAGALLNGTATCHQFPWTCASKGGPTPG